MSSTQGLIRHEIYRKYELFQCHDVNAIWTICFILYESCYKRKLYYVNEFALILHIQSFLP